MEIESLDARIVMAPRRGGALTWNPAVKPRRNCPVGPNFQSWSVSQLTRYPRCVWSSRAAGLDLASWRPFPLGEDGVHDAENATAVSPTAPGEAYRVGPQRADTRGVRR